MPRMPKAAATPARFADVFTRLRAILVAHAPSLVVVHDTAKNYYLDSAKEENGKPVFFGAVRVGKTYVSFYLMGVYRAPEMLDTLSDSLKEHMQGKSCWNFTTIDDAEVRELAALTERCLAYYKKEKLL
jgi:hypothetical protein